MEYMHERFIDFTKALSVVILREYRNANFRYEVLLLIKKFFKINMLSFLAFNDETEFKENYRDSLLDNVTLGLSRESIEEYYSSYYLLNPLYNSINVNNLQNQTKDLFADKNFVKTDFYHNFYKKHGSFYLLSLGIKYEDRIIGILSFMKTKELGDFSKEEVETLKHVRDLVGIELSKVMIYEELKMENLTMKESEKYFPVAKLVLDNDYTVIYNNSTAVRYIKELTESDPLSFKYFFINDLITKGYIDTDKKISKLAYKDFVILVSKEFQMYNIQNPNEYFYSVFIAKKLDIDDLEETEFMDLKILTKRELEVASLIGEGLTNEEIARKLVISPYTVKTHTQRIYSKLNVTSRVELIYLLFEKNKGP